MSIEPAQFQAKQIMLTHQADSRYLVPLSVQRLNQSNTPCNLSSKLPNRLSSEETLDLAGRNRNRSFFIALVVGTLLLLSTLIASNAFAENEAPSDRQTLASAPVGNHHDHNNGYDGGYSNGFPTGYAADYLMNSSPKPSRIKQITAVDLYKCSRDTEILAAFRVMQRYPSTRDALHKLVNRPVHVFFKDLKTFGQDVKHYDALSWMTETGQLYILIHEKHKTAPPEALAALISHEVMHDDLENSVQEEVTAWTQEAKVWHMLKTANPNLASLKESKEHSPLLYRLNLIESAMIKGQLDGLVRNNPAYSGIQETSPGFPVRSAAGSVD